MTFSFSTKIHRNVPMPSLSHPNKGDHSSVWFCLLPLCGMKLHGLPHLLRQTLCLQDTQFQYVPSLISVRWPWVGPPGMWVGGVCPAPGSAADSHTLSGWTQRRETHPLRPWGWQSHKMQSNHCLPSLPLVFTGLCLEEETFLRVWLWYLLAQFACPHLHSCWARTFPLVLQIHSAHSLSTLEGPASGQVRVAEESGSGGGSGVCSQLLILWAAVVISHIQPLSRGWAPSPGDPSLTLTPWHQHHMPLGPCSPPTASCTYFVKLASIYPTCGHYVPPTDILPICPPKGKPIQDICIAPEKTNSKIYMHPYVDSSTIHNSQDMEAA